MNSEPKKRKDMSNPSQPQPEMTPEQHRQRDVERFGGLTRPLWEADIPPDLVDIPNLDGGAGEVWDEVRSENDFFQWD